eukprot:Gregarina_sp_Poly_1__2683@NODE_1737_length_3435_cov_38_219715_g335_i1_p1_GENE_NODE_1737_length_3435_cov_38_219715_g335_i1NODE_1737_length_3435_cov_38_219715_g335_i1_p1_ORF_typecomplete_len150_score4_33_NODE_1737_length_3435_cov_38_219715_g335_i127743223
MTVKCRSSSSLFSHNSFSSPLWATRGTATTPLSNREKSSIKHSVVSAMLNTLGRAYCSVSSALCKSSIITLASVDFQIEDVYVSLQTFSTSSNAVLISSRAASFVLNHSCNSCISSALSECNLAMSRTVGRVVSVTNGGSPSFCLPSNR